MARLVVVSSRVSVPNSDGARRAGGLEVALRPALERTGGIWFGWSGKAVPRSRPESHRADLGAVRTASHARRPSRLSLRSFQPSLRDRLLGELSKPVPRRIIPRDRGVALRTSVEIGGAKRIGGVRCPQ